MSKYNILKPQSQPQPKPQPQPATQTESQPQPPVSPQPLSPSQPRQSKLPWIIVAILAAMLFINHHGCDFIPDIIPDDDEVIVVDDKTPSVLFALDGDSGLSEEQADAVNSQLVREWCEKNGIPRRVYDISADLIREDEKWQQMMTAAKSEGRPPCMVTTDVHGKGRISDIPSGVDPTIAKLEKLK